MRKSTIKSTSIVLVFAAVALALGGWLWQHHAAPPPQAAAGAAAPGTGPRVLYWYDPMKPEVHFDHPGKSPYMDMELLPKYAEAGRGAGVSVGVDAATLQNLGMRTAPVERGALSLPLRTAGTVMADEHRLYAVQARAAGWVRRLEVRAVGDAVRRGQRFAEITSPELIGAQQELRLAQDSGDAQLAEAARQRLALFGGGERGVAVTAPADGVVTALNVREGAQVTPGAPLAMIADLSQVWIEVAVPEAQGGRLAVGQKAVVRVPALPGRELPAAVAYVYPDLDAATRSVRARLPLANPGLLLRPGMFAEVTLEDARAPETLLVPSEAVIRTGTRCLVIVADEQNRFHPARVTAGAEAGGRTQILSGLELGQRVVTSGQFLIDSEANLDGALERLDAGAAP